RRSPTGTLVPAHHRALFCLSGDWGISLGATAAVGRALSAQPGADSLGGGVSARVASTRYARALSALYHRAAVAIGGRGLALEWPHCLASPRPACPVDRRQQPRHRPAIS